MKPKHIILIRHGESEGNVNNDVYKTVPDPKIPLTLNGKHQAVETGRKLKTLIGEDTVQFYVSPYLRTRQTYDGLIEGLNIPDSRYVRYEDPRIREQDWGHFRGIEDIGPIQKERYRYGSFFYRFPNGESGADVFDRVSTFLETMYRGFQKPHYPHNVIIVTHGLAIRLFLMRWYHQSVEEFESLQTPDNCEYIVMELQSNGKYAVLNPLSKYVPPGEVPEEIG